MVRSIANLILCCCKQAVYECYIERLLLKRKLFSRRVKAKQKNCYSQLDVHHEKGQFEVSNACGGQVEV